ncbi:hypothetical protein A8F94_22260 [Bacillus sp. FJAT-27225]|uniref:antitoxin VbhA family protein n=1 Tax=Bacillus sp. FJAT-27225 TaxID=1743144 RepID=UPI00080C2F17|nr:antitoxin VbhA family protein [Bacillus sp. FJAT-27225]OCA81595.1 hypothetical protein A8F94_22260 [Bacillus sp. FJAT-27225]
MTEEERIDRAMKRAEASLAIDGFIITDEHRKLVRSRLQGSISEEEFLKKVLKYVKGKHTE